MPLGSPRDTSLEAFREIVESGRLKGMRREIYVALYHHGPATSGELTPHVSARHAAVSARLGELVKRGVARENGARVCNATGYSAIEYDVTSLLAPTSVPQEPKGKVYKGWAHVHGDEILGLSTGTWTVWKDRPASDLLTKVIAVEIRERRDDA